MLRRISRQVRGYLKIRITGYSPERFLNLCKNKNIEIWNLESKAGSYEMFITISNFRKLKPLLKKTRTKIEITEKYGTPFFFYKYRKRKVFFIGIFFCILFIYIMSLFIWKIDVQGNHTITDEVMVEYLETEHVYHGMKISKVDCEKIGTKIRKQFDDIIWVSVSLEGSNLIIQVKENTDTFQVSQTEESPSDIIAASDGIITKIITRNGNPCVKVGDEVKKGDLLVTGKIDVMNDAAEVIREEYKSADADIWAEVMILYDDFCELKNKEKKYNSNRHKQVYLNFFGYQFAFGIKKSETKSYEITSWNEQLKIHDNFKLPIYYGETIGNGYELVEYERTLEEQKKILEENILLYFEKLEQEGTKILENQVKIQKEANGLRASGYLRVEQSIGSIRKSIDF